MFGENLKTLRKNKGITQEELAARLNVVRQTISKWEKGQSVPDAEMLAKLAEIFEVPVSQLLGSRIEPDAQPDALAEQLARINEQLVIKNRRAKRIWTAIAVIVAGAILLQLLVFGMIILLRTVPQNGQIEIVDWTESIEKGYTALKLSAPGRCCLFFKFKFAGEEILFQGFGGAVMGIGNEEAFPFHRRTDFCCKTGSEGVSCDKGYSVVIQKILQRCCPNQFLFHKEAIIIGNRLSQIL